MAAQRALLRRVIRSDRVHLKKGDVEWFWELLDLGEVPPGHYGQFGRVEANRPYFDRVMQWARARDEDRAATAAWAERDAAELRALL